MEEKERYYYKEYAGDYDILDRNDKNAYYGAISRDKEDAQNLINLLNQQSKRIKELENMNSRLSQGIYWGNGEQFCDVVKNLKKENQQLKQQLAITEKALELAVDDKCYAENCIAESFIGKGAKVRVPKKEQWYLERAKEMLENE